jgi:hypothetical protein
MTNAVTTQQSFAEVDDDGGANAGTLGITNDDWTQLVDSVFRIRFMLDTTAKAETDGYYLYANYNGTGYARVTPTSSNVQSVASGFGTPPTDGTATSQRLGSGTFTAGEWDDNGAIGSMTIPVNNETEHEFCLSIVSGDVADGLDILFEVRFDSGGSLDGYTNTPTVTIDKPSGEIQQGSFRWRTEGAEETVNQDTWEAALDTDVTLDMMTVHGGLLTRLRAELVEVNGLSKTITPKLQYRINAGSWVTPRAWNYLDPGAETGTFDPVMIVNKATTTDGAATTNVLAGSAKAFVAGTMNHDATAASVSLNNQHTELEWAILISHFYNTQQYLSDGDTIDFRVVESDDTLLDGTYDYPRVTVNIPDGYIGGTGIETSQNFSFIKIPDGTLYAPIEDAELGSNIMMLKSSDGGKSWTPQDNGIVLVANDMEAFSMAYDDTRKVIHCLHVGGDAEYYQFGTKDHGTDADQWIEIGGAGVYRQQIEAGIDATNQSCELILRGSTLYAFYPDDTAPEVIYYKKKTDTSTTNNWGSRVAVDSTGGTTDFSGVSAVVGPKTGGAGEPLIHIFYSDHSNLDIFHRSLDTSDVLGTIHTITTDMSDPGSGFPMGLTNAIAWESGGSECAMIAFSDATNSYLNTVIVQDDGTPDSPQVASNSVVVLDNPASVNARQPVASLGLDGTTAWIFYADDATADLWRASNANGAGWTGHAEELDGVTVHAVRGQAFTHSAGNGGATVFGFIWETQYNQGGTPRSGYEGTNRYDEYVIAVAAVGVSPKPTTILQAINRASTY